MFPELNNRAVCYAIDGMNHVTDRLLSLKGIS